MKQSFIDLTRNKMGSVVQIYAEGYAGEDVRTILNPKLGDLKDWSGSGFFIQTQYGEDIIITNSHVAKNARSLQIMTMLTSEETFKVEIVGIVKNNEPDIAVLRLKRGELKRLKSLAKSEIPYLSLRQDEEITRGTSVKAIGYPMGMTEPNITGGEISNFISGNRFSAEKYVTDAAINPGNSGGPAIDEKGLVIGINTSIHQEAENIGFITPFMFIDIILKNIFENNSICFSDIGGSFQKNSQDLVQYFDLGENKGIIVSSLEKSGSLALAGVKIGDVLLSLNDIPIDRHGIFIKDDYYHRRNIFDVFKLIPLDELYEIKVWRKGTELKLQGNAAPFATDKIQSKPIIKERTFIDVWGMTIQPLSLEILESFNATNMQIFYQILKKFDEYKERLVVTYIEKESLGYNQDWGPGEVIESVNGEQIKGLEHLLSIINDESEEYIVKSEEGTLGVFQKTKKEIKLLNPTIYLK